MLLSAHSLLLDARTWIDGGGVLIARGVVQRVLRSRSAVLRARGQLPRAKWVDLDGLVLAPGLVNAHAHLELTSFAGRLVASQGFVPWIRSLVRTRQGLTARELRAAVRSGAAQLLSSGTTSVGDIDSTGASAASAAGLGLRVVVYREVLDAWDPGRTARALARVRRRLPRRPLVDEGLSPHAPYTTSRELLAGAATLARERALPLTVHWAETDLEERWLAEGTGAFARILARSPRRRGLDLLEEAGLLTPRTSLVHGNHPGHGDPQRLAGAGVTVVHCPGTHAFFARAPFPLRRYLRAGVAVALGTDSSASNEVLDMTREMALARSAFPGLPPGEILSMATERSACALGLGGRVGHLRPGAAADLVAWRLSAREPGAILDELTAARPRAERVWIAGHERLGPVRPR